MSSKPTRENSRSKSTPTFTDKDYRNSKALSDIKKAANKNFKKIQKIKLNGGARKKKDKDFLKTIRHTNRGDLYYQKLAESKAGPVTVYSIEELIR